MHAPLAHAAVALATAVVHGVLAETVRQPSLAAVQVSSSAGVVGSHTAPASVHADALHPQDAVPPSFVTQACAALHAVTAPHAVHPLVPAPQMESPPSVHSVAPSVHPLLQASMDASA